MDFKHQEAVVVDIKKSFRSTKQTDRAATTAINLHPAGVRAFFKIEEAQQLLPIVFKLTKRYSEKVTSLMDRIHLIEGKSPQLEDKIEGQINDFIQDWQNKMTKLGGLPKGLWLLDFDSGDGYFCWKYPERKIQFWHQYQDGFSKRVSIEKYIQDRTSHLV